MVSSQGATKIARITVVESPGCHFCVDAVDALTKLGRVYDLTVDTLDIASETGRELMATHRAALSPLVLLDGEFFSHGRLPRRKLERALVGRGAERVAG